MSSKTLLISINRRGNRSNPSEFSFSSLRNACNLSTGHLDAVRSESAGIFGNDRGRTYRQKAIRAALFCISSSS